jgi:hypothetical protein
MDDREWYEDHELCNEFQMEKSVNHDLYLCKNGGFQLISKEFSAISQQVQRRGHKKQVRYSIRPVNATVGTYLFLLGIYHSHSNPRYIDKRSKNYVKKGNHFLFSGEKGGRVTAARATNLMTSLISDSRHPEDSQVIERGISQHRSLLAVAEKCFLVRRVQETRDEKNRIEMESLFISGNAVNIGYITSDSVTKYYNATKCLIEMQRGNDIWFPHFKEKRRGRGRGRGRREEEEDDQEGFIPDVPKIQQFEFTQLVRALRFLPEKNPLHTMGVSPDNDIDLDKEHYFQPPNKSK